MPLKVAGIDDAGNLPARFEARLAAMLTAAKARANHTGTQDAATTLTGLTEAVQDILGSTLVAGTNVDLTYDDGSGTLTITSLGGGGTPGGTDPEGVRDTMAAALTAGANITITPDDVGNTITISSTTDPEMVRDTMAAALLGSGLITVTANDTGNTITLATTATANSSDATLLARANHTGLLPLRQHDRGHARDHRGL